MRLLFGSVVFATSRKRDAAQTFLAGEAAKRGLTAAEFDFGPPNGVSTGLVAKVLDGQPGLLLSYSGTDVAIQQAQTDLEAFLNGQWDPASGSYFGSMWRSTP